MEKPNFKQTEINRAVGLLVASSKLNIVIVKDKGGIGATVLGTCLISVARDEKFAETVGIDREKLNVAAFSADPENKLILDMLRGPSDPYQTVGLHNVNKPEGLDGILNVLDTHASADMIITDFRANGLKFISEVTGDPVEYFSGFEDAGFRNVVIIPIDGHPDTLQGLRYATAHYGANPIYVAAHRSSEAQPYDYTVSRTQEYFDLVAAVKKKNITLVEWNMPQISKSIISAAKTHKLGYLDKALIATGSIQTVDKIRFNKAKEQFLLLFKELFK